MSARTRQKEKRTRIHTGSSQGNAQGNSRKLSHGPSHLPILQLGVSIWNQWRANEPLTTPNLRNADLRGFHLENVNLCRADLRGADLSSAYLYEADFQAANLRRANLTRAGLIGANLHRANIAGACVQQAYLAQSDLSSANLTNSNLHQADLQSALLTHTALAGAVIAQADLTHTFDLTAAQLIVAKDPHLAEFSNELRVQMGLPIKSFADRTSPSSQTLEKAGGKLEPIEFAARRPNRPVEVFQPARKSTATLPALRRLAIQ